MTLAHRSARRNERKFVDLNLIERIREERSVPRLRKIYRSRGT